jgi:hypothetical protein
MPIKRNRGLRLRVLFADNMKSQIIGLRIASVCFGLGCLAFLARLLVRLQMHPYFPRPMRPGIHPFGIFAILLAIALSGILCVWMWSLSSIPPQADTLQSS